MRTVNMLNNSLFVCYYGTRDNSATASELNISLQNNLDVIVYPYQDTSTQDVYFNLWKCSIRKMDFELKRNVLFNTVLAINTDNDSLVDQLLDNKSIHTLLKKDRLFKTEVNKLYYCMGNFVYDAKTTIDTSIFYTDSTTFGIVANFGVAYKEVEKKVSQTNMVGYMRDAKGDLLNDHSYFYYFLKSLKLKTECINYEDSSMYKRTT